MSAVVAAIATGCGANLDGAGNDFDITARIVDVGERSGTVEDVVVTTADGEASGWFRGRHQLHDNYKSCDDYDDYVTVGDVMSPAGIGDLDDLDVGQTVRIVGKIRGSASACGSAGDPDTDDSYDNRPVFDIIEHGYASDR